MIFKAHSIMLAVVCCAVLSGCALNRTTPSPDGATQTCDTIRQKIIANNYTSSPPYQNGNSPTIAAQLYNDYEHYNCPALIESNKQDPLPPSYKNNDMVLSN
jgi:hypothetical protein